VSERKRDPKWLKTLSYILIFVIFLVVVGHFLLPLKSAGVILWMLLACIGLTILIRWHARCFSCRFGQKTRVITGENKKSYPIIIKFFLGEESQALKKK
jgi:energy-coupling factor transporter transmembrane protein EcfT